MRAPQPTTQSHVIMVSDDEQNRVDDKITFSYPISETKCPRCQVVVKGTHLIFKKHLTEMHQINEFTYTCSICSKAYETMNGVKGHYTHCRKAAQANDISDTSNTSSTHSSTGDEADDDARELICTMCSTQGNTLRFDEKIQYVTHMRHKHPTEYNKSIKVASVRVAWTEDEDLALARLEVRLKQESKGQIVNRLAAEWSKMVKQGGGVPRSKTAIRGRRQQPDYKRTIEKVRDTPIASAAPSTKKKTDRKKTQKGPDRSNSPDTSEPIRKFLKVNYLDSKKMPTHITEVLQLVCNSTGPRDPVESAYLALFHDIDSRRKRSKSTGPSPKTTKYRQKPIKNLKRAAKSNQYKNHQNLYHYDKNKLVSAILDGCAFDAEPPPVDISWRYYNEIWGKTVDDVEDYQSSQTLPPIKWDTPIQEEEIVKALKTTKKSMAAGPDTVQISEIRRLPISHLCIVFNTWLLCRRIPKALKMNRTVLIPKGSENLDDIRNWRPITISSAIIRLYNKIIGHRMSKILPTNDNQLGFKQINGCARNTSWLNLLIKDARLQKNDLYICLLDVSKAFDSVPHQSIIRALKRKNAPQSFIDLVQDQYHDTFTSLSYKNLSSKRISVCRGVKQGDPLSSLLFNLVMDELFDICGTDFGYTVGNNLNTNLKCFADDIVLVSGSQIGMNSLLKNTVEFLKRRGLQTNPKKCMSIGIMKGYKGKKSKVQTESIFTIEREKIPVLGMPPNYTKYLGVRFSSHGANDHSHVWKYVKEVLVATKNIRVKPQNKIDLLRSHIIPRFLYILTHTELYPIVLHRVDREIRRFVRETLHLPTSLSNEFFYLPIKRGGLQIANIHEIVGAAKIRNYEDIVTSRDLALIQLHESYCSSIIDNFRISLGLGGQYNTNDIAEQRKQIQKDRINSFNNKIHGVGAEIFCHHPRSNLWLQGNQRWIDANVFIKAVKLRTNTTETRVTCTRGQNVSKICRHCKKQPESIMHIIQFCEKTRGMRYLRHHRICHIVSEKLQSLGHTVFQEKSYLCANTQKNLRPDIVSVIGGKALVLDITVVYERNDLAFIESYKKKVEKYRAIENIVKHEHACTQVDIHGLTIGARGSYFKSHLTIWRTLGFSEADLSRTSYLCMKQSLKIISTFRKHLCLPD